MLALSAVSGRYRGRGGSRSPQTDQERERLREDRKVQQEIERERERLDKERRHSLNALAALESKGDLEGAERIRCQRGDVDKAPADVDCRAANVEACYLHAISNVARSGKA